MTPDLTPEQLDLLIRLTSGELAGAELERARAEVAADPVLAAEYELQMEALSFLTEQPVAPMADFEAARMRRGVMEAVTPTVRSRPSRTAWMGRLLPVAAALAVVVLGVGFVMNLGGGDTADSGALTALSTEAPAETEAARSEMAPAATEAPAEADAPDDFLSDTADDAGNVGASEAEEAADLAPIEFVGELTPELLESFAYDPKEYIASEVRALHAFAPCDAVEVDGVLHTEALAAVFGVWEDQEAFLVELTEVGGPDVPGPGAGPPNALTPRSGDTLPSSTVGHPRCPTSVPAHGSTRRPHRRPPRGVRREGAGDDRRPDAVDDHKDICWDHCHDTCRVRVRGDHQGSVPAVGGGRHRSRGVRDLRWNLRDRWCVHMVET